MNRPFLLTALLIALTPALRAKVSITQAAGWFETAYAEWLPVEGATDYAVYIISDYSEYSEYSENSDYSDHSDNSNQLPPQLIRNYGTYARADVPGLSAGSYRLRIVPIGADGSERVDDAAVTEPLDVLPYDRTGYAHFGHTGGVGAYTDDGTLKPDARVLYIYSDNARTVQLDVVVGNKQKTETRTGLQSILAAYEKGYETRPLDVRILGTLRATDLDYLGSKEEGLQVKGKNNTIPMNITIEGIGRDATLWGFGLLLRNAFSVELRNFAIMLCMDDCVSIDTHNSHIWVHNLDLFYGQTGSDSDQAKGDGTIDMKGDSQFITVAANHFWDSGKSSLCGMKSETGPNWITYCRNWFDHSDSRHPRIRTMSVHVLNNYFDGTAKYGVGVTTGASAFVEANCFRACPKPMLISMQGTDTKMGTDEKNAPTFSKEDGGIIKAYANLMDDRATCVPWSSDNTVHFDAYFAATRDELVPATVTARKGGAAYSNFDTDPALIYDYTPADAADVPALVTGPFGAGRLQHGDFLWEFDNAVEDANAAVIPALKDALQQYRSAWKGFFPIDPANAPALTATPAGDPAATYRLDGTAATPAGDRIFISRGHKFTPLAR